MCCAHPKDGWKYFVIFHLRTRKTPEIKKKVRKCKTVFDQLVGVCNTWKLVQIHNILVNQKLLTDWFFPENYPCLRDCTVGFWFLLDLLEELLLPIPPSRTLFQRNSLFHAMLKDNKRQSKDNERQSKNNKKKLERVFSYFIKFFLSIATLC